MILREKNPSQLTKPMLEEEKKEASLNRKASESSVRDETPPARNFYINEEGANREYQFPDNAIKTSRYNLITFLPVNLFEQFRRVANFYFLVTFLLQLIPDVSPFPLWSIAAPLGFILAVTAVKQAYEDTLRHLEDRKTNNQVFYKVDEDTLKLTRSKKIKVGEILRLEKGEFFPADIILIGTSNFDDTCYVNTAELDGETAPKLKRAADLSLGKQLEDVSKLRGEISASGPVAKFDGFQGRVTLATEGKEGKQIPLSDDQLCLRGSKVDNTEFVFGVVYATGKDTKLMLNRLAMAYKFSSFEDNLNSAVFLSLGLQIFVNILFAIVNTYSTTFDSLERSNVENGFLEFFTSFILFSYLIPLSLYVTLEFVRVGQGASISQDKKLSVQDFELDTSLIDAEDDSDVAKAHLANRLSRARSIGMIRDETAPPPKKKAVRRKCIVKTTDINEELGQVEVIFSDKTGTLTKNKMILRTCFIDGVVVQGIGAKEGELDLKRLIEAAYIKGDQSNSYSELVSSSISGDKVLGLLKDFIINLLLNNEIIVSGTKKKEFQSLSPDEIAFVEALYQNGIELTTSSDKKKTISYKNDGKTVSASFKIHAMLRFSADRKRMSVVCEDESGRFLLLSKGADSKMVTFADESKSSEMLSQMDDNLSKFASNGNRTLVFVSRELSKSQFKEFKAKYDEAQVSLSNREQSIEKAFECIETDMDVLGCTAVEDPLQDGVPEAVNKLVSAGIEVIVLTGDKKETAVAIGKQANIVRESSTLLIVEAQSSKRVRNEMQENLDKVKNDQEYAMIINGNSLEIGIQEFPDLFLDLLSKCQTVICSRATPGQKAEIVNLVKKRKKKICLAIGDGANDVSMIQKANVGIGLTGKEGNQAAQASDYVLHRFRHLPRLLFVHGRYSYIRLTKVVLWSFYKNTFFPVPLFLYGFFSDFSDTPIYDALIMTFFNMFFTSLPPLAIGWTEKDIPEDDAESNAEEYKTFRAKPIFDLTIFFTWLFLGIYQGLVVFWLAFGVHWDTDVVRDDGKTVGLFTFGAWQCTALIIIINATFMADASNWTAALQLACFIGVFAYFLGFSVYGYSFEWAPDLYGVIEYLLIPPASYLYLIISIFVALVPLALLKPFAFSTPQLINRFESVYRKYKQIAQK